jgi:hypothetical protein
MFVSREVRKSLKGDQELTNNPKFVEFINDILDKHAVFMELGSLGPDLPYYSGQNLIKAFWNSFLQRPDMPTGVEQWSYQLHCITTNIFPLKMIETLLQDRPFQEEGWAEEDKKKLAFICGYLTHMAADQIIHPVVNLIAGPYYKRETARTEHRDAEVTQDLFIFDRQEGITNFPKENFGSWCDINKKSDPITLLRFRYVIQRAFIETYYVAPLEYDIEEWVKGALAILYVVNWPFGPYKHAQENLSPDSEKYKEYIELKPAPDASPAQKKEYEKLIGNMGYMDFFNNAVELSSLYIKATFKIYERNLINKFIEGKFKKVVSGADLSAPLERNILAKSKKALEEWENPKKFP